MGPVIFERFHYSEVISSEVIGGYYIVSEVIFCVIIRRLFLLCPLFRGYFFVSIIRRLFHYSEVISICVHLLCPLFRGCFYCVLYSLIRGSTVMIIIEKEKNFFKPLFPIRSKATFLKMEISPIVVRRVGAFLTSLRVS